MAPFSSLSLILKSLSSKKLKTNSLYSCYHSLYFFLHQSNFWGKINKPTYSFNSFTLPIYSSIQENLGILPYHSNETSHLMPLTTFFAALILFDLSEATDMTEHSLHIETHSTSSFCGTTFSSFS